MKKNQPVLILLFLTIFSLIGKSQNLQTITTLEKKNQVCLDQGINMLGCSKRFYFQMDSVLNVVYVKLRRNLSENDKALLKKEQLQWLQKRDTYFKKKNKEFQAKQASGEWGSDMAMIIYGDQATFVKARVAELIKRVR